MKTINDFNAKMEDGKLVKYSIETWLPLFPGFYYTWLDSDNAESSELDYINERREEKNLKPVTWDDVNFDYDEYYKRVAKAFLNAVESELINLKIVSEVIFQKIVSPKYYNFSNDSVNCEIFMKPFNAEALQKYLFNNRDRLNEYLRHEYTSCSGFISSYGNSFEDWQAETEDFLNWERNKHHLGAILQFVLLNEGITDESIVSLISDELYTINVENYSELIPE